MSANWVIEPSYKFDLASFSNFLSDDPIYAQRHPDAYKLFLKRLPGVSQEVRQVAKELYNSGVLLGPGLANFLSVDDYNGQDIGRILACLDHPGLKAVPEYSPYLQFIPMVKSILSELHAMGLLEYWTKNCQPELTKKCAELTSSASCYPVIDQVSAFLGEQYTVKATSIKLFLCHFSAPHGVSIFDSALLSDVRWPLETQVPIVIHEMMHPPFAREAILKLTDLLSEDEFLLEAKQRLPKSSGYKELSSFVEENLVEAGHVYLAHQMGLIPDPLQYFVEHDHATHVLSAIVYNCLCAGWRTKATSYEGMVQRLVEEGIIAPGKLRDQYLEIYKLAGKEQHHPYLGK